MPYTHCVVSGATTIFSGPLVACQDYMRQDAGFGWRIVNLASMERIGRDDFLRGDCDRCEVEMSRAGFTRAEIRAYQRGFNAEASMHGFD